jgi:hypothetical protein
MLWALFLILATGSCGVLVFRLISTRTPTNLDSVLLPLCLIFFTVIALGRIRNAIRLRGVVVTVGRNGILDRRISEKLIPWPAVIEVTEMWLWRRFLVLKLDPSYERNWPKHFDALFIKTGNRLFGWNGYLVTTEGLKASFRELHSTVMKHWKNVKSGPSSARLKEGDPR